MSVFYVAPDGDDRNAGSLARPFATPARAVAAARAVPAGTERRILLRGGAYHGVALDLGPGDSGLVLAAVPGERPVLYGGRRLCGWQREGTQLLAVDLPGVQDGTWDFRHLLVDGCLRPRARLPATGRFEHESRFDVRWMSTTGGGWERKPTADELTHMVYRAGDLGPWLEPRNAEFTIFHQWDESCVGVQTLDPATRTVTFSTPAGHPPGAFGGWNPQARTYVVWNVREGLTSPGQWCLDRRAGRLVYWPLPGETPETLDAVAPATASIIRIAGEADRPVRGLVLCGLTLAATTTPLVAGGFAASAFAGALAATHTAACRFEGLTVAGVGGHGVRLQHDAGSEVVGCEVRNCGAGGVYVGKARDTRVSGCHVHGIGVSYPSAQGLNLSGDALVVVHNEIHDVSYSALGYSGGAGTRVEGNLFYDFMRVLSDGAAVYVTFCRDTVIRRNVARGASGTLAHAYYLDEQAENCRVEENVAVDTRWPSHNHMARGCTIRGNLFVDAEAARITLMKCHGFTLADNLVVARGGIRLSAPPDGIAAMPRNLFSAAAGPVELETLGADGYSGAGTAPLPLRDGSLVNVDPGLCGDAAGGFSLAPDGAAARLGLALPDVSGAGRPRPAAPERT